MVLATAAAASVAAALCGACHSFAAGVAMRPGRGAGRGVGLAALSWQQRLDKALLDVNARPQARLRNLRKVLQDPAVVLEDVSRAVSAVAENGFREGHVEAIDILWPKGTTARKDLEGIQALRKQVPEVLQDLWTLKPEEVQRQSRPRVSIQDLTSGLVQLVTDPQKQEELVEEAKNAFRQKPRGLETPSYSVVRKLPVNGTGGGVVELRRYAPFTVARRAMPDSNTSGFSSGEGFMNLAGYLFGKNSDAVAMEMTSPVEISYDGGDSAVMSFVLPKAFAETPPKPEEDGIEVVQVPERLVAVKAFPGVVTEGEIQRQRTAMAEVLAVYATEVKQVNASEYSVLQYNPPYTLPWRRLNELAVVVEVAQGQDSVLEERSEVTTDADSSELAVTEASALVNGTAMAEEATATFEEGVVNSTLNSVKAVQDGDRDPLAS